ncbi:hypothetical protein C8R43DRAFT_964329 [Mycena crocata]|nr:hypothetical protein C8R43DRAFT_964329 [Mycena crocata]
MSTPQVLGTQRKARLQVDPSIRPAQSAHSIPGDPTDPNKFLDTWFQPVSTSTIIHRNDWNEVPSKHAKINGRVHFSVNWKNPAGVWPFEDPLGRASLICLLLKFYFGISGCVIPFGFSDSTLYAFTIAGPTALKGKKEMWKLALSSNISDVNLVKFKDLFASPADFHRGSGGKVRFNLSVRT